MTGRPSSQELADDLGRIRDMSESMALELVELGDEDVHEAHAFICDATFRVAARLQAAEQALRQLRERAAREPLEVDISDYGDEWCAGFLAGQVNALDAARRALEGAAE